MVENNKKWFCSKSSLHKIINGISILMLLFSPLFIKAQKAVDTLRSHRTTETFKAIGIAHSNILDTYISSEKYRGTELRFLYDAVTNKNNSIVSRLIRSEGRLAYVNNRADTNKEFYGMYEFSYGLHYNWSFLSNNLLLKVGGMSVLDLGFLYNTRNSNNSAQGYASVNIVPNAVLTYHFRIKKHPFSVRYELSLPLVGLTFSPNYGQSYYEIFSEGNYDHNIVPTTFISAPNFRQMLSLDFQLWKNTFRIGYIGDIKQMKVNNLKTHSYSNGVIIGIVKRFQLLKLKP